MEAITQAVINYSKLELSFVRITKATPETFNIYIECKISGTGPVSATMAGMQVDLVGPAGAFGKLQLPTVKTSGSSTALTIEDQTVKITDFEAFNAFVKALIQDKDITLHLKNGHTTLKALAMTNKVVYEKPIEMKGMNGPQTRIEKTEITGSDSFTNHLVTENPSPFEIDLGEAIFDIQNASGEAIGTAQGPLHITRGKAQFTMSGKINKGVSAGSGEGFFVGTGSVTDSWAKETNKYVKAPVQLTPELMNLAK
ncbi:hypothetical protein IWX49DRAFT_594882 [Phyllosticta citricarpa]|uniref:Uncharacterized protein n=2 Tax=Phyllosticta TaxID=121621 RepID=A0ABR1LS38_9PEZI